MSTETVEAPDNSKAMEAAETLMNLAISVSEFSGVMTELSGNSRTAADRADGVATDAESTASVIRSAMGTMDMVASALETSDKSVSQIAQAADKIARLVASIREIASHTRLLALNAAIEDAHASDDRSAAFSVVAQEVRNLADRSGNVAREVSAMLGQLTGLAQRSCTEMRETKVRVEDGSTKVNEVGMKVAAVIEVTKSLAEVSRSTAGELDRRSAFTEDLSRQLNLTAVNVTSM